MLATTPRPQNRVRQLRTRIGMSQQRLATATGLPIATIGRIDAHESVKISLAQAVLIARALGVEVRTCCPPTEPK